MFWVMLYSLLQGALKVLPNYGALLLRVLWSEALRQLHIIVPICIYLHILKRSDVYYINTIYTL